MHHKLFAVVVVAGVAERLESGCATLCAQVWPGRWGAAACLSGFSVWGLGASGSPFLPFLAPSLLSAGLSFFSPRRFLAFVLVLAPPSVEAGAKLGAALAEAVGVA